MRKTKIKVVLVDDHAVVRLGIKSMIESVVDIEVIGEASNVAETYEKVAILKPDILLLDIKLPDGDGVLACKELKIRFPKLKIIILTAYAETSLIMDVLKSGADGYLLKDIEGNEIIKSIRKIYTGESVLDGKLDQKIIKLLKNNSPLDEVLTEKENQILMRVAEGKMNKEIGKELFISGKTVRNHLSKIYKKINVSNRTEAAIFWQRQQRLK